MNTIDIQDNIMLLTDSYKVSHYRQLPPGIQYAMSFFESRGGRYPSTVFFGLQYLIKKYLMGVVITEEKILEAKELLAEHFNDATLFNESGWRRMLEKHQGRLPIEIKAVLEGTIVPTSNVLVTVVNTDPEFPWLTNYVETLLVQLWYPTTVATQSWNMKRTIREYLEETGTPELLDFKLHDFGYRGSTSVESAGIGGLAHLVNFQGTDTLRAIQAGRTYYHIRMAGNSIPAAEHFTVTSWGRDREADSYRNMLTQYPKAYLAVVSDSYDIYHACKDIWGQDLKEAVLARDGVLVIRPDSGDPLVVLPKLLDILAERFGYTTNGKGFKVLHDKIRLIQGDGINYLTVGAILEALKLAGWSADNIAFGSGGGLLQELNRDTQKFAFKCCAVQIGDDWHDVLKDPVTDPGKRSKAGRLILVRDDNGYRTATETESETCGENLLVPVFRDGELLVDQTFADIRMRAAV